MLLSLNGHFKVAYGGRCWLRSSCTTCEASFGFQQRSLLEAGERGVGKSGLRKRSELELQIGGFDALARSK